MNERVWIAAGILTSVVAVMATAAPRRTTSRRKPPAAARRKPPAVPPASGSTATRPLSPEEARVAVAMLGDAYDLLLDEVHATYHTRPSVPVAATVIRKLQTKMKGLGWPQSRFLAVNAIVMHPDHVPRDEFEKQAVEALRRGDARVEVVEAGQLRVATVVPLGGGCTSCHWTPGSKPSKAAITWRVPLREATERDR